MSVDWSQTTGDGPAQFKGHRLGDELSTALGEDRERERRLTCLVSVLPIEDPMLVNRAEGHGKKKRSACGETSPLNCHTGEAEFLGRLWGWKKTFQAEDYQAEKLRSVKYRGYSRQGLGVQGPWVR